MMMMINRHLSDCLMTNNFLCLFFIKIMLPWYTCFVTIHWSQSWAPKVHGASKPPDWGCLCPRPSWYGADIYVSQLYLLSCLHSVHSSLSACHWCMYATDLQHQLLASASLVTWIVTQHWDWIRQRHLHSTYCSCYSLGNVMHTALQWSFLVTLRGWSKNLR